MKLHEAISVLARPRVWIPTIIIAALYILTLGFFMSAELVQQAFAGGFLWEEKLSLLSVAILGMWSLMTPLNNVIIVLLAFLTGFTITLTIARVRRMRSLRKRHFIASSGAILGMIGSGCAACSLPVLTLFGLAGSTAFLPFGGEEILWVALVLQIVSLYFLLKTELVDGVCAVEE
jgi:hypothetical protein